MRSGIYKIYNTANQKVYVGASDDVYLKIERHKNVLYKGKHHNRGLQNDWNTYGNTVFEFTIIEFCGTNKLCEQENFWIAHNKAYGEKGYNSTDKSGYFTGNYVIEKVKITSTHIEKLKEIAALTENSNALIPTAVARIDTLRLLERAGLVKLALRNYGRITEAGMQLIQEHAIKSQ